MPKYRVMLPVVGTLTMEVEADSRGQAVQTALESQYDEREHELEWETTEAIVEGNVFYGRLNRPSVELLEGDE